MSHRHRWIALSMLMAACAGGQTVTKTAKVKIDGRVEQVRQINGRWWSEDNRQLRPTKGGWLWWINSKRIPESVFHHHRPVTLAKAESLDLFMDPDTVRSILGDPNETFEVIGIWH